MKPALKNKMERAVSRIEAGNFDELVVDGLLAGLRQYSRGNTLFRELADFVSHPDERNEGAAIESLEAFYLSIRYFLEYPSEKKALNLSEPFPRYIVKLIKYQIDKCKEGELKEKYNVTKHRLKARIDTIFSIDKKSKMASVKNERVLQNNFSALEHVLSFIGSHPAFEQNEILQAVVDVVRQNDIKMNEDKFREQSEKFMLAVLLLMHEVEFHYGASEPGSCAISCENISISHNQQFVDPEGNPVERKETFGNLQLLGHVVVPKGDKGLSVCYPILCTSLDTETNCHISIFKIEALSNLNPNYLVKKADFNQVLAFTEGGLLGAS